MAGLMFSFCPPLSALFGQSGTPTPAHPVNALSEAENSVPEEPASNPKPRWRKRLPGCLWQMLLSLAIGYWLWKQMEGKY
jgi:hypothetical protein